MYEVSYQSKTANWGLLLNAVDPHYLGTTATRIVRIHKYLRPSLKTVITAYFYSLHTIYTSKCIIILNDHLLSTTTEMNVN